MILLTRSGTFFINAEMQQYLGISWAENPEVATKKCIAVYPGLQSMTLSAAQTMNAVFDTSLTSDESTLLFKETASFSVPRGLGVWRKPAAGGIYRSDGGQFVFISGQPFRYNSNQLQANMEYILANFFHESKTGVNTTSNSIMINNYKLEQNYPNPFNPGTTISYQLAAAALVDLTIYNSMGQRAATLISKQQSAGYYSVVWDASGFSAGVYFCRMKAGNDVKVIKLALVK